MNFKKIDWKMILISTLIIVSIALIYSSFYKRITIYEMIFIIAFFHF